MGLGSRRYAAGGRLDADIPRSGIFSNQFLSWLQKGKQRLRMHYGRVIIRTTGSIFSWASHFEIVFGE